MFPLSKNWKTPPWPILCPFGAGIRFEKWRRPVHYIFVCGLKHNHNWLHFEAPLRGIPSQNPVKLSAGFTTSSKMYNRPSVTKKEGGAKVSVVHWMCWVTVSDYTYWTDFKLIDLAETPEMLRKRRREMGERLLVFFNVSHSHHNHVKDIYIIVHIYLYVLNKYVTSCRINVFINRFSKKLKP